MEVNHFTILYWFCHTSTWIRHRYTCVPHLEPPSHLPPHTIPLGPPSAPAPSILYPASNLDWRFISCMILYMFQCHSPIFKLLLSNFESKNLWSKFSIIDKSISISIFRYQEKEERKKQKKISPYFIRNNKKFVTFLLSLLIIWTKRFIQI